MAFLSSLKAFCPPSFGRFVLLLLPKNHIICDGLGVRLCVLSQIMVFFDQKKKKKDDTIYMY